MPITGYMSGCLGSVAVYDAAANAWFNAVVANGGSVSDARKAIVSTLLAGLRTDGILAKLDRLWILAAENTQSALTDMIALELAVATSSPTFTTDRGYTFNGTTNYINTAYNPGVTSPAHYAQNSATLFGYSRVDVGAASQECIIGCFSTSNAEIRFDSLSYEVTINDATRVAAGGLLADTKGFFQTSRTASTTTQSYKNGSALGTNNATASTALPGHVITIGAQNGTADFSSLQIAAAGAGQGLNSTEAGNLSSRINTYMTSVGANVF